MLFFILFFRAYFEKGGSKFDPVFFIRVYNEQTTGWHGGEYHSPPDRALSRCQQRWCWERDGARNGARNGEVTYELVSRVRITRLHGDVYLKQVLSGHDTFGDHHARFFRKYPACLCRTVISNWRHYLYFCALWRSVLQIFFLQDFQTRLMSRRLLPEEGNGHCKWPPPANSR